MAELQKNIRRVGGGMESSRQPYGRRLLLPSEIDLCKTLGISEDEYWFFVDQTAAYNGQRKEGYELIPDIKATGLETFLATTVLGTTVGQIAVSVALTAIGYLLTPKPKPIKASSAQKGADAIGSKRFAPQFAFNSIQELATIGDVIPLVFANQSIVTTQNFYGLTETTVGGIRVSGQLLWSQLLSLGKLQQLKALVMFSSGEIENKPEFEGYAIGDLLLSSYSKRKVDLFFKSSPDTNPDNRIGVADKYSESAILGMDYKYPNDVLADKWPVNTITPPIHPFSGARNPTTQSTFGIYSPMPNASVVNLSFELNQMMKGGSKDSDRAIATKAKKNRAWWPTRAGFTGGNVTNEGNTITYHLLKSSQPNDDTYETGYKPHGIEDVVSMIRSIRENIDSQLSVGETYMAGDALVTCESITTSGAEEGTPWRPTTYIEGQLMYTGIERICTFKVIESGTDYDAIGTPFKHPNLYEHAAQPKWLAWDDTQTKVGSVKIRTKQDMSDYSLQYGFAYRNPVLQKAAIGTVTNSRSCSMTEIGLKSKVFGSINGANLNSVPEQTELRKMFDDKVQFQLGRINHYLKRFSFFYLQMREAGKNGNWETLVNTSVANHSGLFCIRGNTPEFQYNFIRINHPKLYGQYEFRFKPYPGNNIPIKHVGQCVNLLNSTATNINAISEEFAYRASFGDCVVSFSGQEDFVLEVNELTNTEWKVSYNTGDPSLNAVNSGPVTGLSLYNSGVSDDELTKLNVTIQASSSNHTPNYEPVVYEIYEDRKEIDLISLNKDFDPVNGNWAWIVYENGVEVGYEVVPAGTPSTEVTINAGGNIYKPSVHPSVINHPEDNSIRVDYYDMDVTPDLIMTGSS